MTIGMLARHLGLSESTVSKALNDRPDVSLAVKDRVREAARSLGYRPNIQARRLARGSSDTLGVFLLNRFGRPVHEYFGFSFLGGIMDAAEEEGKEVLIMNGPRERSVDGSQGRGLLARCLDMAAAKGVEGVIFVGLATADAAEGLPEGTPVPVASIDTPLAGAGFVTTDNAPGLCELTGAVIDGGARRIVYLGLRGDGHVAQERRRGYLEAMAAAGLAPDLDECPLNRDVAREWALRRLSSEVLPEAVVCASDLQALGVLDAAADLGMAVPGDLGVTGFDGIPQATCTRPALSTWAQDPVAMGRAAVDHVCRGEGASATMICPGRRLPGATITDAQERK